MAASYIPWRSKDWQARRPLLLGLRYAHGQRGYNVSPLDPRNVAELMAGGIWLPENSVVVPGTRISCASSATQTNTLTTQGITGDLPTLTTATNGATVWNFAAATYTSLQVVSPGSALNWTDKGTYAGWFKANSVDGSVKMFFSQWPEGTSNNRIQAALTAGDNTRLNVLGSRDGSSADVADFSAPDHRWKYNSQSIHDFTQWHFLRWTWDVSLTNYGTGTHYSYRLQFFVDEVWDEGSGYSAPHDGPGVGQDWGSPPDGPVRALYGSSTTNLALGSDNSLGGAWRGLIGPFYVAKGEVPSLTWRRVMQYHAPA